MKYLYLIFTFLFSWSSLFAVIPGVIKIYDEKEIEQLLEEGVSIERRRGDILLCYFPDSEDNNVIIPNSKIRREKNNTFRRWVNHQKDRIISPSLDESVKFFDAWKIQEGEGLGSPLTGKGVVVGICDIGLDPLHPTFLDENGNSRIKRITQYKEYDGIRIELEGDQAYSEWATDTIDEYHATHVAGILAGNGGNTPYKGIAPDAEIVVSLSCLSSFGLLMGVEDIIDYAKEVDKPAVINLSMGNYIGAHDGTSLFSQYLDMCADDAIIVLSAGNEGLNTNTLRYSFDNNYSFIRFRIGNRAWNQRNMYGVTDIWNTTARTVTLTIGIFDDENHTVVFEYEPITLKDWDSVTYEWNPESPLFEGLSLNGFLTVTGGIDPENGRYEVTLMYDYSSGRIIGTGNGWAKDMICIKAEALPGDEIDIFADGTYTRLMPIVGYPAPNANMSISDLACGYRVVSTGMYGNREYYPVTDFGYDGEILGTSMMPTGSRPLQTVPNSSYGTLRDGRTMPLTVAPGMRLVSAVNRHYLNANEDTRYFMDADGAPWINLGGTSMSSPYVAGYIATWLELLPHLTVEDIIGLISETNSHEIPDPSDPRNINGYFNPYLALRKALNNNGIHSIKDPSQVLMPHDHVDIFTLTGLKIYSGRIDSWTPPHQGIYIIHTPFGIMKKYIPT